MKIGTSRAALARSAITGEIAAFYLRNQKGGRRGLRRCFRAKCEIYVRAVLASSGVKPGTKRADLELRHMRKLALQTWRQQIRRITGQGVRAFTSIAHDQLALFGEELIRKELQNEVVRA